MSAEILALLDSDPAAGILAVADLREQRAKAQPSYRWRVNRYDDRWNVTAVTGTEGHRYVVDVIDYTAHATTAEHIAAEANPAHALAAVLRWKKAVERHQRGRVTEAVCIRCFDNWPCPDLRETADEARAYLGGAS